MKRKIAKLLMICIIGLFTVNVAEVKAQYDYDYAAAAPDSVSIDDMDPIFHTETDGASCPARSNTTLYILIVAAVAAGGFIAYKKMGQKKE